MASKPRTYEIQYKAYYGETSEHCEEYLEAATEREALQKFAWLKKLGRVDLNNPDALRWEEGVWECAFKFVKPVSFVTCPHCGGAGKISVNVVGENG